MKNTTALLALILTATSASATEYTRPNASLVLTPDGHNMAFSINSSYGETTGVCNMEGIARTVPPMSGQKGRWVWSDNNSQCVAVISEIHSGLVEITTKGCDGYCGLSATGSMDGRYHQ